MRHEKIFKRPDGTKVKIEVWFTSDAFRCPFGEWDWQIKICGPNKKKFYDAPYDDEWNFRKMSLVERREFLKKCYLVLVTREEVLEVQLELWEKIKPNLNSLN